MYYFHSLLFIFSPTICTDGKAAPHKPFITQNKCTFLCPVVQEVMNIYHCSIVAVFICCCNEHSRCLVSTKGVWRFCCGLCLSGTDWVSPIKTPWLTSFAWLTTSVIWLIANEHFNMQLCTSQNHIIKYFTVVNNILQTYQWSSIALLMPYLVYKMTHFY